MKTSIAPEQSYRLINPGNIILVSSAHGDKKNIVTLAWSTPISRTPPLIGICVAKKHFTVGLIEASKEFVINIPNAPLLDKTIFCGKNSGRVIDKFQETGFTAKKPKKLSIAPLIGECPANIECQLKEIKELGDHKLYVGEVVYAEADDELFKDTWDVSRAKLIHHFGGTVFATADKIIKD